MVPSEETGDKPLIAKVCGTQESKLSSAQSQTVFGSLGPATSRNVTRLEKASNNNNKTQNKTLLYRF